MIDTDHIKQAHQWKGLKTFIEIKTEAYHKVKRQKIKSIILVIK
jgi:hypothetical protein